MKNELLKYKLKNIIPGSLVDESLRGKEIAPVNLALVKKGDVKVKHKEEYMIIKRNQKALCYRTFPDKFGRFESYNLAYYEWIPYRDDSQIKIFDTMMMTNISEKQLQKMRKAIYGNNKHNKQTGD